MEPGEFNTSSTDREERLKARRERIAARTASKNEDGRKLKTERAEKKEMSGGKQQVADSLAHLDKTKASTIEAVTSIRVEADNRENIRRIQEEERRQDRLRRLQEEAVSSGKRNAAVEMRWAELMEQNMPQELLTEIESQKDSCSKIVDSKDRLIKGFQGELKAKDEEYVKSLKRQAEDIELLLKRMSSQFKELREEYEQELEQIESAFMKERDELLAGNKAEIDTLFDKRRNMEIAFMESKQEREESYQAEIEELRVKDSEDYNKLKIKLETDIQTLEQQLEEMRATYQLNTEKLEYNYRVLTERDMENSATLSQQKRKLSRLKDLLSGLVQRYGSTDAEHRSTNQELTEEYRRITKQYKDLQTKFTHFEVADNRQHQEVWDMHEQEVSEMVTQVLQADRVIHEQQLGWSWNPPPEVLAIAARTGAPGTGTRGGGGTAAAGREDGSTTGAGEGADGGGVAPSGTSSAATGLTDGGVPGTAGTAGSTEEGGGAAPEMAGVGAMAEGAIDHEAAAANRVSNAKVKAMLELLCAETGFLVDAKLQFALQAMGAEEASVMRADSILKALGVETAEEVQTLLSYFFTSGSGDGEYGDGEYGDGDEDPEEETDKATLLKKLGLKIQADDVVRVIKRFVEEREELRRQENNDGTLAQNRVSAAEDSASARRERNRREERRFWEIRSNVIPDKSNRVWQALEGGLVKYNTVLKSRASLIQEVSELHSQNEELKALLGQYLNARVNQELHIPPAHTTMGQSLQLQD